MRLTNWMTGWVKFRVVTPGGGERFLNSCARAHILLWKIRPGKAGLTAFVRAGQYAALRVPARRAKVRLRILKKGGLPLQMAHLTGRPGLVIGFLLFWVVLLGLGQQFWTLEVSGCKTIPEAALRAALAEQGVAPGAPRRGFSAKEVQLHIMEKFPQISWISVNNHGSDLFVQLTEKDEQPPLHSQSGWYQLRAAESGTIVDMHIAAGTAVVKIGDGVVKGQLLVSAAVENPEQKFLQLYHAAGTVTAETKHTLQVTVPLSEQQWKPNGPAVRRRSLQVFGVQLPLSMQLAPKGKLQRSGQVIAVRLCGRELPLSYLEETLLPVRSEIRMRSREEAEAVAKKLLSSREKEAYPKAEVLQRTDQVQVSDQELKVTRQMLCHEDIAQEVKISP